MAFFEWQEDFSSQIAQIDRQHRRLIELVNRLHAAIERSNEQATLAAVLEECDTVDAVIRELMDYACYHFTTEETYMRDHAYPGREPHCREHGTFIEQVRAYQRDFEREKTRIAIDIALFIRKWWQTHILNSDKACGAFLHDKGLA